MNQLIANVSVCQADASITVFKLEGHLDAETVKQLSALCETERAHAKYKWVIDLSSLEYISSAGLGFFMGIISELRGQGGDIFFAGLSPKILKTFNVLGVTQIFKIYGDESEALKAFQAG